MFTSDESTMESNGSKPMTKGRWHTMGPIIFSILCSCLATSLTISWTLSHTLTHMGDEIEELRNNINQQQGAFDKRITNEDARYQMHAERLTNIDTLLGSIQSQQAAATARGIDRDEQIRRIEDKMDYLIRQSDTHTSIPRRRYDPNDP